MKLPEGFEDLFDDAVKAFLVLTTMRGPEQPSVAPVWFVADDRGLLFMSDVDSVKDRNIRRQARVAAVLMAEGEHARYVSVHGTAERIDAGELDAASLYRRIVRRYEGRDPRDPQPSATMYFRIVPDAMFGYDYRDYEA